MGRSAIIGGAESTGVYASDLGNRSLTWETTTEFNVGVDLGIFNNRFKLTAEYFKRKITDLLVTNKPLPFYNEINKIAGNIGSTQSQGVEITVNTVNIVTKDFEWDTTLTLSHYNDRWLTRDPNWKPKPYELSLIHISEPTRRTPISYAVFCLKKKKKYIIHISEPTH